MRSSNARDVIVIGAGPNGLAAAVVCAKAGLRVTVYEAEPTIGGGARTAALTLPGFAHDVGSSIYPFGAGSPFFRSLPIERYGVAWLHPRYPLAHPLDDGDAVVVDRSLEKTAAALGEDGSAYAELFGGFVGKWERLAEDVLAPLHWPVDPFQLARFGALAVQPMTRLARRFRTPRARALLAGMAAHSAQPLDAPFTSAFALMLGTFAHAVGWPVASGGAQSVPGALAACLAQHGGEIEVGERIESLSQLPAAAITLCDIAPEHLARVAGTRLPARFTRGLRRFRRSTGAFKMDWALDGPIPWRAEACAHAGTVHLGGTLEEIAESEQAAASGRVSERPFVLLGQPSVCDPSRAPAGGQAVWGYCHVPIASAADMTDAIERQIERYAPGFRERILARHALGPADLMRANANLVGGDITGGAFTMTQSLNRPTWRTYRTPAKGLYLCSASTPPGAGVHGMCGYWAARTALRDMGRH
ncbi:MAG TPA: NAD(P)/FAD-dependent oxidoreductase [Vicinamibacterales bacterium]|nr:NAD(P)/FAD-dependent oxidoreductase [Vicinamibacterales bacterium]